MSKNAYEPNTWHKKFKKKLTLSFHILSFCYNKNNYYNIMINGR